MVSDVAANKVRTTYLQNDAPNEMIKRQREPKVIRLGPDSKSSFCGNDHITRSIVTAHPLKLAPINDCLERIAEEDGM